MQPDMRRVNHSAEYVSDDGSNVNQAALLLALRAEHAGHPYARDK